MVDKTCLLDSEAGARAPQFHFKAKSVIFREEEPGGPFPSLEAQSSSQQRVKMKGTYLDTSLY